MLLPSSKPESYFCSQNSVYFNCASSAAALFLWLCMHCTSSGWVITAVLKHYISVTSAPSVIIRLSWGQESLSVSNANVQFRQNNARMGRLFSGSWGPSLTIRTPNSEVLLRLWPSALLMTHLGRRVYRPSHRHCSAPAGQRCHRTSVGLGSSPG